MRIFLAGAAGVIGRRLTPLLVLMGPEVTGTTRPDANDPVKYAATREANARIRIEGTRNLMAAAKAAGVRRAIAQSVAFAYAPGAEPHHEDDPLALEGPGKRTAEGITALEWAMLRTPPIEGVGLRHRRSARG